MRCSTWNTSAGRRVGSWVRLLNPAPPETQSLYRLRAPLWLSRLPRLARSAAKLDTVWGASYLPHMLRVDLSRWLLTEESLTELCLQASHPRTRERLLAVRDIAGGRCASRLCAALGRNLGTVLKWVHDFNQRGPSALSYRHTGGTPVRRPQLASLVQEALDSAQQAAAESKKAPSRC